METTLAPQQIDQNAALLANQRHREHLGAALGHLAEVVPPSQEVRDFEPDTGEQVGLTPKIHEQAQIISEHFAQASDELGPEATEEQVWDAVLDRQIDLLSPYADVPASEAQVLSFLTANVLSTYGQDPKKAQSKIDERMWEVAMQRAGFTVIETARNNNGICVVSDDPEHPYRSIVEQTEKFGALFIATDRSVDEKIVDIPVPELAEASINQKARFLRFQLSAGNGAMIKRNFADDEITDVFKEMLQVTYAPQERVQQLVEEYKLPVEQAVEWLLEVGRTPTGFIDMKKLPAEQQKAIFRQVVNGKDHLPTPDESGGAGESKTPEERLKILLGHAINLDHFSELGVEELDIAINMGVFKPFDYTSLKAFKDLPEGSLDRLKQLNLFTDNVLVDAAKSFTESDRRQLYDSLLNSGADHQITANPDKFDIIPRSELLDIMREKRQYISVAGAIHKWTDGSDKELILELLDGSTGSADSIAQKIDQLPNLDTDWFVGELERRDDLGALVTCLKFLPNLDQDALFERSLAIGGHQREMILGYNLKNFKFEDTGAVLDRLIEVGAYDAIAKNTGYFEGETPDSIVRRIGSTPEGVVAIAKNLYKFPDADRNWLTNALVENGELSTVAEIATSLLDASIDGKWLFETLSADPEALGKFAYYIRERGEFQQITAERVFQTLLDLDATDVISLRIGLFTEPSMHQRFLDKCIEQRAEHDFMWKLDELSMGPIDVARQCIAAGWEKPVLSRWNELGFLKGIDQADIPSAEEVLSWGGAATLLCSTDVYPDIDVDSIFQQVINKGDPELLAQVLVHTKLELIPNSVGQALVGTDFGWVIRHKKEKFDKELFTSEFMEQYLRSGDERFIELYEYSGQQIEWLDKQLATFGRDAPPVLLLSAQQVLQESDEPLPQGLVELGVTRRGQAGIEQLRRINGSLRQQLVYGMQSDDEVAGFVALTTGNELAKAIAKQLTRFGASQWGQHTDDAWTSVMQGHFSTRANHAPLAPEFVQSELYNVRTIDAKEFDPSKIDEDARNRFIGLQESLQKAFEVAELPAKGRFGSLFAEGKQLLLDELERLGPIREGLVAKGNQKGIDNIESRIAGISEIANMSTLEFMRTVRNDFDRLVTLNVKGFDSIVRVGMFARALTQSSAARILGETVRTSDVTFDALANMNDFVDHIVNQEVYRDYFADDNSRKSFERLSDTTALRAQLTKAQSGQVSGQTTLQFVPSRGIALELSGHMGDACWASKYESIANEFPGITSLTYVRNPGTNSERIVGAGLVIDTVDQETGEPVLILRGTNPIENYINGVKVEDFFGALSSYMSTVANGKKVAVVIDNQAGSGATNRPVLFEYLNSVVKPQMTDGRALQLPADTTFNGYLLTPGAHPVYTLSPPVAA